MTILTIVAPIGLFAQSAQVNARKKKRALESALSQSLVLQTRRDLAASIFVR